MAGFTYRKNLDGSNSVPSLLKVIGKNSVVFTVGDAIRVNSSGFGDMAETTEGIIGIVQGVVDSNGLPVDCDSGKTDTWTMASDNQTVAKKEIMFIPAFGHYAFSCDSDTTIELASIGKYFALNSTSDGVVTSGESFTIGSLDVQLIGVDPDGDADASKGLYRIVRSQMAQSALVSGAA